MPLQLSDTQAATEANFHHQRHGKKFRRTAKKYGKKRAQKQLVAIVLSNKRKAAAKKTKRKRA
jgi:hypothetical protein